MNSGSTQHFVQELLRHLAQFYHMAHHQQFMLLHRSIQLPTFHCQTFQIMNLIMVVMAICIKMHVLCITLLPIPIPLRLLTIQTMLRLNLIKSNRCHIIHLPQATIQSREEIHPFIQIRNVIPILTQKVIAMRIITSEQIT